MTDAAARALSVISVSFCLSGSIGICLCDNDPDDCGECCHDCADHSEDECRHLTIDLGDFMYPQSDATPAYGEIAQTQHLKIEISAADLAFAPRPSSTAPPDTGGVYTSYSSRIHQRS